MIMGRRLLFGSLALLVCFAALAISMLQPAPARGEQMNSSSTEIRVDNFTFEPETLTVSVNSTVTWVNKDDVPHVIASDEGLFKSKALDTDDHYTYTFTKAGTYAYYCTVHPKMVGKIVVR
jgi:plastocyanin